MKTYTLFYLFISILISGCSRTTPPEPGCRQHPKYADLHRGSGACMVRLKNNLLVIEHQHSGKFDLVKGESMPNEKSQCAAHRHMWEQTGFNAQVSQLLGVTSSGLRIYACQIGGGLDGTESQLSAPSWAPSTVGNIRFINPFDTRYDAWVKPNDLILIRDSYVSLGYSKVLTDKQIYQSSQ